MASPAISSVTGSGGPPDQHDTGQSAEACHFRSPGNADFHGIRQVLAGVRVDNRTQGRHQLHDPEHRYLAIAGSANGVQKPHRFHEDDGRTIMGASWMRLLPGSVSRSQQQAELGNRAMRAKHRPKTHVHATEK